ncbi:prealbumin-like fold domain-containing protein [Bacillus cereus]
MKQGKVVTKVTTDKEGKAKISDLSVGNYKLVEVESLPGYKKANRASIIRNQKRYDRSLIIKSRE